MGDQLEVTSNGQLEGNYDRNKGASSDQSQEFLVEKMMQ